MISGSAIGDRAETVGDKGSIRNAGGTIIQFGDVLDSREGVWLWVRETLA